MEGNKEITFSVAKQNIINKISLNSYYRGERLKEDNGSHAARMQAGSDNNDIISNELELAAADIVSLITRNLGRCHVTLPEGNTGSYSFITKAASNFPYSDSDDSMKTAVEGAIESYMFDKALEGWLLINMPNEVQALGQRSVADAEKLRQLLIERSKPV